MKKLLFLFVFIALTSSIQSQQTQLNKSLLVPDGGNQQSLPEIQKSFNDYWDLYDVKGGYYIENGEKKKAPGWKIFKRWEYYWEQRVNQTTGEFPTTNSVIEYEKYLASNNKLNKTTYDESWINLGTNSSTGGYAGIGRINCIAFHPTDVNTIWVGSPSGGIWKTTNLNLYPNHTWTIINDNELVLGVSDIVVDYTNPNILYIATGDRDGGSMWSLGGGQGADNVSIGVLKSTDGGSTWYTTGLSYAKNLGKKVYCILIHPSNNFMLFASTSDGVFKTTDSGANWVLKSSYPLWRMAFKPGDPTVMYGTEIYTGNQWFDKSTDTGETWIDALYGSGTDARRTELAVTPNDPTVVYLLCANSSGGLNGVYKSTNSGVSFFQVNTNTTQNMLGYYSNGTGGTTGQGGYDLCIAASPSNANIVYIGGVNTWISTDGGITWNISNMWTSSTWYNFVGAPVAHADKHALAFQNGTTLFEGNDGGIYKTTDVGTNWTDLSNGLVISQLYRIGVSQTSVNTVLTGLQDNGSKLFNGGWTDVKGGDGMECIVDYSNSNYMYATYVRGQISRSTNGGFDFFPTNISANIPGGQPTGAWVTPYVMDQNNSSTLFAGYDRVWKTSDRGNSWTSASQSLSPGVNDKLRSIAIAPSNSSVLYTADQSNMWKTTDGGTTNWSNITSNLPSNSNSITYIAVKNTDPNTVWITYGGYTSGAKVYESIDGGSSWANISTGLPNLPVMSIVYYKIATDRNVLFVGTDMGVYVKDGTNNWVPFNTGLPNVVVTELEILYTGGTNKLRAGTFGRGLWETTIDAALPVELSSFTAKVLTNGGVQLDWTTETEVENYGFDIERTELIAGVENENLIFSKIGFAEGHGNSNSPKEYTFSDKYASYGKYAYRLKQIDTDGEYEYSNVIEVDAGNIPGGFVLEQNYPNPFNPATTIKFSIPEGSQVSLKIYNSLGQEIKTLVDRFMEAGVHTVNFNAVDLNSGMYFYKLNADEFNQVRKMTLIK